MANQLAWKFRSKGLIQLMAMLTQFTASASRRRRTITTTTTTFKNYNRRIPKSKVAQMAKKCWQHFYGSK